MSEPTSHVEAVELEHKPGSVDRKSEAPGKFPFDAFDFTEGGSATPTLNMKPPWGITMQSGSRICQITISTSAASGTPADGDMWLQRET